MFSQLAGIEYMKTTSYIKVEVIVKHTTEFRIAHLSSKIMNPELVKNHKLNGTIKSS